MYRMNKALQELNDAMKAITDSQRSPREPIMLVSQHMYDLCFKMYGEAGEKYMMISKGMPRGKRPKRIVIDEPI